MNKSDRYKLADSQPHLVAAHFVVNLHKRATPQQWNKMVAANANDHGNHEHDFCDANMEMLAAYCAVSGLSEAQVDLNRATEGMQAAWNIANITLRGGVA